MYKIYQVEYGDTIDIIADKTGTTADNIKKINDLNSDNELIVGNLIIVPKNKDMIFETYKIKQGDTIYSISRKYNIDSEVLLGINGLNKNDYIYPNQEIIVPIGDVKLYITKPGDTIEYIINNLNTSYDKLVKQNDKILVADNQLIISKKELN